MASQDATSETHSRTFSATVATAAGTREDVSKLIHPPISKIQSPDAVDKTQHFVDELDEDCLNFDHCVNCLKMDKCNIDTLEFSPLVEKNKPASCENLSGDDCQESCSLDFLLSILTLSGKVTN